MVPTIVSKGNMVRSAIANKHGPGRLIFNPGEDPEAVSALLHCGYAGRSYPRSVIDIVAAATIPKLAPIKTMLPQSRWSGMIVIPQDRCEHQTGLTLI